MLFDGRLGLKAPCLYKVYRLGKLCPYIVQVALATDRSRVPGRSEGAITSMDVIAAQDTINCVQVELGKWHGDVGGGSPLLLEKERVGESEGMRVQSMFQSIDATSS